MRLILGLGPVTVERLNGLRRKVVHHCNCKSRLRSLNL